MIFNKDLKCKEEEEEDEFEEENSKDLTEKDFIQINKDISKALFKMKEEKDNDSNESPEESEKELANFDIDFFSESSNSFSMDNNSGFSENSIKSANVEMNRNNLSFESNNKDKNEISNYKKIKNNINKIKIDGQSDTFNKNSFNKKYSFKSTKNERNPKEINSHNGPNLNSSLTPPPFSNYNNNNNFSYSKLNKTLYSNNKTTGIQSNLNNNINNLNTQGKKQQLINNNLNNINNINNLNNFNNLHNINNYNLIPKNYKDCFQSNSINNLNNSYINNIRPNLYLNNNIPNNVNSNIINPNNNIYNNINNNNNYNVLIPNNNVNLKNINCNNLNIFNCSISEGSAPKFQLNKENVDSPKNIIHIENILKSKDKRTTLIIRNIPNRYTISLLLNELNQNNFRKYDVVYLPQDYINNSNLGFGFINFLEHMYLIMFYEEFVGKKWNCFNSNKRCQLAYSKYQGKNELTKYIHKKLGISSHYNNNENLKKSFYINNDDKYPRPLIEIPIKYYKSFLNYYPFSLCHIKNDKVFIVDKYYNF